MRQHKYNTRYTLSSYVSAAMHVTAGRDACAPTYASHPLSHAGTGTLCFRHVSDLTKLLCLHTSNLLLPTLYHLKPQHCDTHTASRQAAGR
jgi:hypothetical protein